eukprot:COSAG01_NODE_9324_length_2483_cov_6.252936_2_plen_158_part_00
MLTPLSPPPPPLLLSVGAPVARQHRAVGLSARRKHHDQNRIHNSCECRVISDDRDHGLINLFEIDTWRCATRARRKRRSSRILRPISRTASEGMACVRGQRVSIMIKTESTMPASVGESQPTVATASLISLTCSCPSAWMPRSAKRAAYLHPRQKRP